MRDNEATSLKTGPVQHRYADLVLTAEDFMPPESSSSAIGEAADLVRDLGYLLAVVTAGDPARVGQRLPAHIDPSVINSCEATMAEASRRAAWLGFLLAAAAVPVSATRATEGTPRSERDALCCHQPASPSGPGTAEGPAERHASTDQCPECQRCTCDLSGDCGTHSRAQQRSSSGSPSSACESSEGTGAAAAQVAAAPTAEGGQ